MKKLLYEIIAEDAQDSNSTPRLPLFSIPMWGFHSEPPGMQTPPLNNYPCSVPFNWEEIPGKPKHTITGHDYCHQDVDVVYNVKKLSHNCTSEERRRNMNGLALECMSKEKVYNEGQAILMKNDVTMGHTKSSVVEEKRNNLSDSRGVLDVVVGLCTACHCAPVINPLAFMIRRRRRIRKRCIVRKLGRSPIFFASMWRRVKGAASLTRKKSKQFLFLLKCSKAIRNYKAQQN